MLAYPSFWRLAPKPSSSKPIRVPGLGPAHLLVRTGDEHFAPVLRGFRYRGDIEFFGKENGNYYSMLGLYRDNGKENGNYFLGLRGRLRL